MRRQRALAGLRTSLEQWRFGVRFLFSILLLLCGPALAQEYSDQRLSQFVVQSAGPLPPNLTYSATSPSNVHIVSGNGNTVSYCPVLSCPTSPSADHQRTSNLTWATTSLDGIAEEQTVAVETIIQTGYAIPWTTSHAFTAGNNTATNGGVYRQTAPTCTSAASGSGPSGTGAAIADGTCSWMWINASAIDSKVGIYNEVELVPGAGASWGQATNYQMQPGVIPTFNINTELDFTNNAANCNIGVANCNNLEVAMGGNFQSTQAVHVVSANAGPVYGSIWGIRLDGAYLASNADMEDDASGNVGIGFNTTGFAPSRHATATIQDSSTSPVSYLVAAGVTHSTAAIEDQSTTPVGVYLQGVYGTAQIAGNNWSILPNGQLKFSSLVPLTGTPVTYACFTATYQLVSSASPC